MRQAGWRAFAPVCVWAGFHALGSPLSALWVLLPARVVNSALSCASSGWAGAVPLENVRVMGGVMWWRVEGEGHPHPDPLPSREREESGIGMTTLGQRSNRFRLRRGTAPAAANAMADKTADKGGMAGGFGP